MRVHIKLCILLVVSHPSFMGYLKSIKQAILLGLLSLAGGQLLMGWPKSSAKYSNL